MKKIISGLIFTFLVFPIFAQSSALSEKKPKAIDQEKAKAAAAKDEKNDDEDTKRDTICYGMASEISTLLDSLIKNEDPRFTNEIYDLYKTTKSSSIREKVFNYFAKVEDPCLEYEAVYILEDPYEEKNEVVKAALAYVSAVKTKEAIPAVKQMIESENEAFFNDAINTLGEIGSSAEAVFIVEYLEREDLDVSKRQLLMRVCGKIHAVETWGRLVDIIEDEDENTFVRMYAAEAIGVMEDPRSIPVLERNFDNTDPNFRQYVIKGISHYPSSKEAKEVVMQGIRDDHWRVRQEAIKAAKTMEMTEAMPFLIRRAKSDPEKVIKEEAFNTIGALNTKEGNEFLVSQVTQKKGADANKPKAVEVLLKNGTYGESEILELAKSTVEDDKLKTMRYAVGKELAKYDRASFADVCIMYLTSKDVTTVSIGLDMYKTGKYTKAQDYVRAIALDKKANASNRKRAQNLLGIDEDELKAASSATDGNAK